MVEHALPALLTETPHELVQGDAGVSIPALTQDSRDVGAGDCFVAVPGFRVDGHDFLEGAIEAGAAAVVVQTDRRERWAPLLDGAGPAVIEVADTRVALADLAAAHYEFPARQLAVVGVTGTDGKSTTCYLTASILEAAGHRTGLIGGIQFKVSGEWRLNTLTQTSPEAPLVQRLLAEMLAAGATHVVIEASSHGLELHRLDHCEFDVAVFTGLSDDHLDFHGTREAYLDAKLGLFRALDVTRSANGVGPRGVILADEPQRDRLAAATSAPLIIVGRENTGLDLSASGVSPKADHTDVRITTPAGALATRVNLPGDYNVDNALLAAGASWATGAGPIAIADGIAAVETVPGRMERIEEGQPFTVLVDAAATSDALRVALSALRPNLEGRLILVVGVAGERDPERRAGMGEQAASLADYTVITSENPRSEDPAAIVRDIAIAMQDAGAEPGEAFEEEPDRRHAIARAFAVAADGDTVVIAGKGAEQSLIFADHEEPWDDRQVARELLAAR